MNGKFKLAMNLGIEIPLKDLKNNKIGEITVRKIQEIVKLKSR